MARVLGVGVGVFLIAFFLALWLVFIFIGRLIRKPALSIIGFLMLLVVVLVLTLSPHASSTSSSTGAGVYSTFFLGTSLMAAMMAVAAAASCIGVGAFLCPKIRHPSNIMD